MAMRAFLVDDEALALKRLQRMLAATKRVQVQEPAPIRWRPCPPFSTPNPTSFSWI